MVFFCQPHSQNQAKDFHSYNPSAVIIFCNKFVCIYCNKDLAIYSYTHFLEKWTNFQIKSPWNLGRLFKLQNSQKYKHLTLSSAKSTAGGAALAWLCTTALLSCAVLIPPYAELSSLLS